MSMRTAIMEMYGAKKVKREAWVPESILDDDVSHFMGAAAAAKKAGKSHFEFGGKKYKVTMKSDAAKKIAEATFATDIDYNEEGNIKKVAKRFGVKVRFVDVGGPTEMQMTGDKNKIMKAVKALGFTDKEIKNAYFKESTACPECGADGECQCEQPVQEAADMDPKDHVKYNDEMEMYCVYNKDGKVVAKFKDEEDANNYAMKNHDDLMEVSYKTAMKSYQKAMGQSKDADTAGDKKTGDKKFDQAVMFGRYANKKFKSSRNKKKLVRTLTKEETVEEAAGTAQHRPTPETSDTYNKQMNNGEGGIPMGKKKDFVNQHNMEVAYDAEELYKQNKYEALSKTPARPGDKSDGDKNVVNPIPTNMVDGMRAALAKMKNSGE